jgi:alginate O-acetyltransferase complex protein AlgI
MVFPDPNFLFFFLPALLVSYYAAPQRWRNVILMVASVAFYTLGGGLMVVLLLISIVIDFAAGRIVGRGRATASDRLVRTGVILSLSGNLGLLGYFKYANFVVDQLNALAANFGLGTIAWTSIILPIGISFYTFQSMSYTIDIARGRVAPIRSFSDFALFVSLFPQLIAGPIVRFHEISEEIEHRSTKIDDFSEGVVRFAHGLIKKVIIADAAAVIAEPVFALGSNEITTAAAWLGVFAYTIQIYFDFSGYSDMAIGLGRMFGFHFPENFRRPYSALSITDFWRRWHITLSNWFRDYVYIPLGGSRFGTARTYGNLVAVFLLTGLWHGANWTFVVWGAYHGALLTIERLSKQRPVGDDAPESALRRVYTLMAVVVGWVLFRADSLSHAGAILSAMFSFQSGTLPPEVALALTTRVQITLVLAGLTVLLPRSFVGGIVLPVSTRRWAAVGRAALVIIGLPYALAIVSTGSFSPFLYYQF